MHVGKGQSMFYKSNILENLEYSLTVSTIFFWQVEYHTNLSYD
jgi:hypothetical protein